MSTPPVARLRPLGWDDWRVEAARRLVASQPDATYVGAPPATLLAIPVLAIHLAADGRVTQVEVLRWPGQARDVVAPLIEAVRAASPYGPVRHLPAPWIWTETFLFDDARRFKPRTLEDAPFDPTGHVR